MKDECIIDILDSAPLASLTEEQLMIVRAHSQGCVDCGNAYRAAKLSSVVIKDRAQATIEPSPFFQTRVLAALREQQAAENVPVLARLWKSAGALVSSMAVTTAALAALSLMVPAPATTTSEQTATAYSAESVLLDQGSEELSYEQVLSAIYAEENEAK
jgi:hypothetical protein